MKKKKNAAKKLVTVDPVAANGVVRVTAHACARVIDESMRKVSVAQRWLLTARVLAYMVQTHYGVLPPDQIGKME